MQAIHPKSADGLCLLWNYHDVLKVLERFGGDTVRHRDSKDTSMTCSTAGPHSSMM